MDAIACLDQHLSVLESSYDEAASFEARVQFSKALGIIYTYPLTVSGCLFGSVVMSCQERRCHEIEGGISLLEASDSVFAR